VSERAAYSRVYWSIVDDPKFVSVYDSDANLAAWLRLLLIADQSHPASAHLPSNVRKSSVAELARVELIDLLPGHRYRVHGLDAERERRRLAATSRPGSGPRPDPSGTRSVTGRSPNGSGTTGLRRDETRKDETRRDSARADDDDPWRDDEHEARAWLSKHGCDIRPGNGWDQHLVTMVAAHGVNAVVGMFDRLAEAGTKNGDTKAFLFAAKDALTARTRPDLRALEREDAAEGRSEARSQRIQRQMWERRLELYRNTGQWDEAWGAKPKDGAA
jgi:hypothetical protein